MFKYGIISIILIGLLFDVNYLYCGTIDPQKKDSQYIEYGEKFIHTGKIYGTDIKGLEYYGSCIAFDSQLILTAAHILHDAKTANVLLNNKHIKVDKWIIHHNFKYEILGYNDIAICLLDSPIDLQWYPKLYNDKNELGKLCSLSGYGVAGTFITGPSIVDNHKRAGSNMISAIEDGVLICDPSTDHTKTSMEFFICPGDSGGGLFIGNEIAGIHSYTIKFKPSNRQYSGHTRISNHIEWINISKKSLEKEYEKNTK